MIMYMHNSILYIIVNILSGPKDLPWICFWIGWLVKQSEHFWAFFLNRLQYLTPGERRGWLHQVTEKSEIRANMTYTYITISMT